MGDGKIHNFEGRSDENTIPIDANIALHHFIFQLQGN